MKHGISWATIASVGLGLFLITTPADAAYKEPTFKVRPDRSPHLLAQKAPRPKSVKHPRKGTNPGVGELPADVSPEAAEVVYLYHHGFTSGELLHYVNKSHADFKLTPWDVNYLKDVGISTDVVVAMIRNPKARENVARLRQRLPGWATEALYGQAKKQNGVPHNTAEHMNEEPTEPVNAPREEYGIPNYYGPSYYPHGQPMPNGYPGYPYGPGPGYDQYDGHPRGFNNPFNGQEVAP